MSRLPFAVLLAAALGCSRDQTSPAPTPGPTQSAVDEMKADEEAIRQRLKTDLSPVVDLAKSRMREAVAEKFGSDAAEAATIMADESGVKQFGPDKWEVTGRYEGSDKEGKAIKAPWTVRVELFSGSLQTRGVSLGKRE